MHLNNRQTRISRRVIARLFDLDSSPAGDLEADPLPALISYFFYLEQKMPPRKTPQKKVKPPPAIVPPFIAGTYEPLLTDEARLPSAASKPVRSQPQPAEQFDMNLVQICGVVGSVWGRHQDVFARMTLSQRARLIEPEPQHAAHVTLRFAAGSVAGTSISIQPGDILGIRGYLVHREYQETLRKFLDEAGATAFYDRVDPTDLTAWRAVTLTRRNGLVNALAMSRLDLQGHATEQLGQPIEEGRFNHVVLEGIVARVWEYRHDEGTDLFARIAVYDEQTPVDPKHIGNFGRLRRLAHYATLRFRNGLTPNGDSLRLHEKMRIRIAGRLCDKAQVVTLRDELLKTGSAEVAAMMRRVTDPSLLSEIRSQQESLHVLVDALIVYSGRSHKP